jgi:hypothetical protein
MGELGMPALQQVSRVDRPPSTPWWRRHWTQVSSLAAIDRGLDMIGASSSVMTHVKKQVQQHLLY